jgi:HSP20 family protein
VDNGMLRIRAERRAEEHDGARSEIRYGMLERVVALPPGTQTDDVQGEYADGVLTVSLPTTQQTAPQTVRHRELPVE